MVYLNIQLNTLEADLDEEEEDQDLCSNSKIEEKDENVSENEEENIQNIEKAEENAEIKTTKEKEEKQPYKEEEKMNKKEQKQPELVINPNAPLLKKNSIHSIIQARKMSISPTNNALEIKRIETPNTLHKNSASIESTFGNINPLSFDDECGSLKKPSQNTIKRQISINISALENSHNKKSTPLSKENSTTNKNNIPTEKVRTKTFNFVNTIFNPKSPNSPNRTILFSEYLVQRLGEGRFKKMKGYLETHHNPLRVLEEERGLIAEFIGEENLDCIKIFKYLMSNVVTPSKSETMIRMQTNRMLKKGSLFEEFKGREEAGNE